MNTLLENQVLEGIFVTSVSKDGSYLAGFNEDNELTIYCLYKGNYEPHSKIVDCSFHRHHTQLAISNNTLIISDKDSDGKRCANVFVRYGTNWVKEAVLLTDDNCLHIELSRIVSISGDGNTATLSARDSTNVYLGAVYVFTRTANGWVQQAKLLSSNKVKGDYFGHDVSLDDSGDTIIVSAWGEYYNQGSAYVFTRSGSTWTQQARLTPKIDPYNGDGFGMNLSISSDGTTAAITAPNENKRQGVVYVFSRSGNTWSQQANLASDEKIGADISIASAGDIVVAGGCDRNKLQSSAYVYVRTGDVWTQQAKLMTSDGVANENLSYFVHAVNKDIAVMGSYGPKNDSSYIFTGISSVS